MASATVLSNDKLVGGVLVPAEDDLSRLAVSISTESSVRPPANTITGISGVLTKQTGQFSTASYAYQDTDGVVKFYCMYGLLKDIPGICLRTGLVEKECRLAQGGDRNALYAPLYLRATTRDNSDLEIDRLPVDTGPLTAKELVVRMNELAIIQPIFMPIKVEMGIMIRRAANRAFGVSNEERTLAHECAANCIKDANWTPQSMLVYGEEVPGIAEALIEKVRAVVLIQDDRGKVWRNRATVDEINRGALEIAAMLVGSLRKSPKAM